MSDTTTIEDEADEQFYRDTEAIAFPKIDDRQLAMLEPLGQRRVVRASEVLFKAGQRDLGLVLILSGELEVVEQRDGTELVLGERGPGPIETSRPGVLAAGDVRSASVKRCAAAVGEGWMAIAGVHQALASMWVTGAN